MEWCHKVHVAENHIPPEFTEISITSSSAALGEIRWKSIISAYYLSLKIGSIMSVSYVRVTLVV